ncbi:hypothetical protein KPL78_13995 [Roseomonas sp. HJA6]|uniref:Uncharacterized protein n=1 Tax=Roseomonas alba TaxID=2846776 RepID=A0ABS7AB30_9PROT|nr:hypothetical protein [Neoroseomonas alba]MBW6398972.1 hypothetical protein [Neoroseomonas alba]
MAGAGEAGARTIATLAGRHAVSDATLALVLGLVSLPVGLGATMAGVRIAYWHSATLLNLSGPLGWPEPDWVSLALVIGGSVMTLLGAYSIYRSQDM